MSYLIQRILVSGICAAVLYAIPAAVLDTQLAGASGHTDEIIVTVRKTEENVQDIPLQVSQFGEQDIQRQSLRTVSDIAELTPSVQFDTGFWPSDTRVSIRGLFARAGRPSAAVLIDGIDAVSESLESSGGSALLNQRVLDIERIEVARGPQSALYGRGAFAGAINYVTRRPQYDWNGSLLADVAEDSRYELQATFGGPIIKDKLAFNALVSGFEYDGPYTNPNTGGGLGASDSKGAGLSFEWKPTDNFTAYWNTTYSDQEDGPVPIVLIKPNAFRVLQNDGLGNTTLIPNADYADRPTLCDSASSGPTGDACLLVVTGTIKADETQLDTEPDPRFETPTDYPGTDDETLRSNLILDWDLSDSVRLRSATSFTDSDQSLAQDTNHVSGPNGPDSLPDINGEVGALNGTASDTINEFSFEQFYQEFQLSGQSGESVNWLVGVNGFFESASTQSMSRFWYRPIDGAFNDQCDFFPAAPCTFFDAEPFDKLIERDTSSVSLFGLIGWNLTDDLKMTLEGRLIHDRIEVSTNTSDTAQAGLNGPDYSYPMTPGFADEVSDKNFVPRASLEYTLSDDALVYVSAAKGIKPPTYNTNDFNEPEKARVKKETLWTYEIGAKTQWNDGRITVNGAIFYNDYKDQQTRIQFPPPEGGTTPQSGVANAGNVNIWGVEIDSSWAPTDYLFLSASYAYTDGEFDEFILLNAQPQVEGLNVSISNQAKSGSKIGDYSGFDTAGNPDHSFVFLGKYQRPLTGSLDWFAQATASYQGERYADFSNLVELEDYWLATAQLGLEQEKWNVAVYADNLFDDDTVRFAQEFIDFQTGFQVNTLSFPVAYFAYLPQPRTVGIRFAYRTP